MSLSKMMHNDLHFGNIFIEKLNEVETITYIINNKLYILNTQFFNLDILNSKILNF